MADRLRDCASSREDSPAPAMRIGFAAMVSVQALTGQRSGSSLSRDSYVNEYVASAILLSNYKGIVSRDVMSCMVRTIKMLHHKVRESLYIIRP